MGTELGIGTRKGKCVQMGTKLDEELERRLQLREELLERSGRRGELIMKIAELEKELCNVKRDIKRLHAQLCDSTTLAAKLLHADLAGLSNAETPCPAPEK